LPSRQCTSGQVAYGQLVSVKGICPVKVQIQGFVHEVHALVLDTLMPDIGMVLGMDFMTAHKAILYVDSHAVMLQHPKQCLLFSQPPSDHRVVDELQYLHAMRHCVIEDMNAAQARRHLKDGGRAYMCDQTFWSTGAATCYSC
jgi:hypothetical protein